MHRADIGRAFIENVERERTLRGWTQQEMAEKLEMSVSGYRKMISGQTESIALFTAYRVSEIFQIPIPILCGSKEYRDCVVEKIYQTPKSICNRVEYYLDYVAKIQDAQKKQAALLGKGKIIDIFTLTGYMQDGMYLSSSSVERKMLPKCFGDRIVKGFKVTENTLLPVYAKGDILLIEENASRDGDIAVFLNLNTRRIYFRKLVMKNNFELHPINRRGEVITIPQEQRNEWFDYGCVVTHIREEELLNME